MVEGFTLHQVDTGEASIRLRIGGSGPPLPLLHGSPQTHVMWHRVAPRLAEDFTVVAPDLRGYGLSSKPPAAPDHEPYSKRAMARDQVAVLRHFGFESFGVAGHDRGGRCAYRLALDHPARITKLGRAGPTTSGAGRSAAATTWPRKPRRTRPGRRGTSSWRAEPVPTGGTEEAGTTMSGRSTTHRTGDRPAGRTASVGMRHPDRGGRTAVSRPCR